MHSPITALVYFDYQVSEFLSRGEAGLTELANGLMQLSTPGAVVDVAGMIMISVLRAEHIHMFMSEDNKMVQAFLADTLDESFDEGNSIGRGLNCQRFELKKSIIATNV